MRERYYKWKISLTLEGTDGESPAAKQEFTIESGWDDREGVRTPFECMVLDVRNQLEGVAMSGQIIGASLDVLRDVLAESR